MVQRNKAIVRGIVQGIGFRPFVYNLAKKHKLTGYILNNSTGVEIDVEGESVHIDKFFVELENDHPPLARITSVNRSSAPIKNYADFKIRKSLTQNSKVTLIPPDICVCDDCLNEMRDPADRRFGYAFINCTNCGPRYTIIKDVPYDRPLTSMNIFTMCKLCQQEYENPENRRFHAQPNACPVCGPRVELFDSGQKRVETNDPIKNTIELLKQGFVVAIKGLGGFHLAVDAENNDAVSKLRHRKSREEKPLALMSPSVEQIIEFATLSPQEEKLISSPQRPIVLLEKKIPSSIADQVAPKNKYFGVMLPYTPLHYLLLENDFLALVMTSGNMTDEPIVIDNDEAFSRLGSIADYFLIHNRDIYLRSDDSIVRRIENQNVINRRARGYVPFPVFLKKKFPRILACGTELKNTICLTKDKNAIVSQHIGDLKTEESYQFFKLTVNHLQKLFDIQPDIVAYDLHPNYICTQFALELKNVKKIGVQHHHAHIVSCMTEQGIDGPVIGLSFDGTGYGTDGKIWGGEVLQVEGENFQRLAHLNYAPMPGGDAAIQEPWRMAVSYLYQVLGDEFLELNLPFVEQAGKKKVDIILQMITKGINCPETSSLGRLFDGVSALLGICNHATYEGQPAIMLEQYIEDKISNKKYLFEWSRKDDSNIIQIEPLLKGIVKDLLDGKSPGIISHKFHSTLIDLFLDICLAAKNETGLDRVVFSGGVFQNVILLTGLQNALKKENFVVYSHEKVPTNDGGISLGQAAVAADYHFNNNF